MARYQQGIGTPETLGVQPTLWKDPTLPKFTPIDVPTFNSGATRNYGGLKTDYLDTMKSRWFTGTADIIGQSTQAAVVSGAKSRAQRRGSNASGATDTEPTDMFMQNVQSASDEPFTPPRAQFVDEPQNPFPSGTARDLSGFMTPPSSSRTMGRSNRRTFI
jgi:hypothetical protein